LNSHDRSPIGTTVTRAGSFRRPSGSIPGTKTADSPESPWQQTVVASPVPVESLEQLFAQASGMMPLLKDKVISWASKSNGMVAVLEELRQRIAEGNTYVKWGDLVEKFNGDTDLAGECVKWGKLKSTQRSIEKLVRSYEGRVCKLLDICRQSIVFETPHDLAACLSIISEDPEIQVLSIKNRLCPDYEATSRSLGYRDVNLNVRIASPDTKRLGIHLHVCEVQLLLKEFSVVKSDAGHKRYVAFRNARGK